MISHPEEQGLKHRNISYHVTEVGSRDFSSRRTRIETSKRLRRYAIKKVVISHPEEQGLKLMWGDNEGKTNESRDFSSRRTRIETLKSMTKIIQAGLS